MTRPARSRTRAPSPVRLGFIGLAGFAIGLEALPRLGLVRGEYFPPPSSVARALATLLGEPAFWVSFGQTVGTWALGLAIAVAAGLAVGLIIGAVPLLRAATASTVEFLRPIPSVALIPLAVVLLGTKMSSTLLLVVYASFWQVLVQVLHGVADVDPVARETALSFRFSRWARVRYLLWPTTLPYAVTGVRLAASVALILTVTGELIIGSPGLGADIGNTSNSNVVPRMYALVVVAGLIGVVANLITRTAERRVLSWHPSMRAEVAV